MDKAVENFVQGKRVAVVGASRSGKKFGNSVVTELKDRGYQVLVVHPEAEEIGGEPCYPNLAALEGRADGVWVCVSPQQSDQVLREAVQAGFRNIWLQQGAESQQVLETARRLGVEPVSGKCILMYAQPVTGFHRWHRGFMKLIGRL